MKWIAFQGTEQEVRSTLASYPGIEILAEGGIENLITFLKGSKSLQKRLGIILRTGDDLLGEEGIGISSIDPLMATLVDLVTTRVNETGDAILDLQDFRLSAEDAQKVARRAGLQVSIGVKAVYTPKDANRII